MKRMIVTTVMSFLAVLMLPAQDIDLQIAAAARAIDGAFLRELDVSPAEIEQIQAFQQEYRTVQEKNGLELNVIRAQIAQMLYNPDADLRDIDRLLERAGALRLEQEKAQVRNYLQVRNLLGEDRWLKLTQRIRAQSRLNQNDAAQAARTQSQNRSTAPSGGSSDRPGSSGGSGR